MNYFDNWKPVWRWVLFIPTFFVVYLLLYIINMLTLSRYFGPYDESSFFSFIYYRFFLDTICLGASIIVSCMCIPKCKILLASIYLGIILILFGFSIFSMIYITSYFPTWKLIYSSLTILVGGIGALVFVIILQSEEQENKELIY
jgi:hypothetical protein